MNSRRKGSTRCPSRRAAEWGELSWEGARGSSRRLCMSRVICRIGYMRAGYLCEKLCVERTLHTCNPGHCPTPHPPSRAWTSKQTVSHEYSPHRGQAYLPKYPHDEQSLRGGTAGSGAPASRYGGRGSLGCGVSASEQRGDKATTCQLVQPVFERFLRVEDLAHVAGLFLLDYGWRGRGGRSERGGRSDIANGRDERAGGDVCGVGALEVGQRVSDEVWTCARCRTRSGVFSLTSRSSRRRCSLLARKSNNASSCRSRCVCGASSGRAAAGLVSLG